MRLPRRLPAPREPLVAAIALLLLSWIAVRVGLALELRDADTPLYQRYGEWAAGGRVPYRDFELEYPPLALLAFVVPALVTSSFAAYTIAFEALMVALAAVALVATALSLRAIGASRPHRWLALVAMATAPALLGTVALSRFDFLPAALVALWLGLALSARDRLAGVALGLAVAAKLYPIVLVPLAVLWTARRSGGRSAAIVTGIAALTAAGCFAPFVAAAPDGVASSISRQLERPLQLESSGASVLLVARELGVSHPGIEVSSGSVNMVGSTADRLAMAAVVLQVVAVGAALLLFARSRAPRGRDLAAASATAVAAFVALGKVFSPQFLLWLVVLAPLVPGRRGAVATAIVLASMAVTTLWFPFRYGALIDGSALPTALLVTRNAAIVALFGLLLVNLRARGS